MKHTPTPWLLETKIEGNTDSFTIYAGPVWTYPRVNKIICHKTVDGPLSKEDYANATFIMEATEAHERLTIENAKLRKIIDRLVINHDPDWPTTPAERDRAWEEARLVLKGETK